MRPIGACPVVGLSRIIDVGTVVQIPSIVCPEQAGRFLAGKVASGAIVSTDKAKSYRRALRCYR